MDGSFFVGWGGFCYGNWVIGGNLGGGGLLFLCVGARLGLVFGFIGES